ncbi:MAG TPA: hydrogenase maturation nickel metallochaperone HypA [Candidatus Marinimicrobia bacterium]|nr:hydrogenase maturation nickel metallochaperone HypA [Candidatus Neomarinimicrobiota bacterium]
MHELQIAQNIIIIVNEELVRRQVRKKVREIALVIGQMRAIIPETLRFSFNIQKKRHTQLEESELLIRENDIVVKCNDCQHQFKIQEPQFYCQKCHSANIEILSGNELYVDSIELAD